ncbi:hypothetical protein VE03_05008 [Pseudogymnoascus sp. 23342-1-I1]|nr:hypothetical protein VE03_05008 [Pseudogymnoascus sp. 23342-1-I1]
MFKSLLLTTASLLLLATPIHAVCGTHTFGHCEDNITHWYDPLTGEICDPIDCGGGRAPPKTNVPGCGTLPAPPASYLSCWTPGFTGAPGPATVVEETTTTAAAPETTVTETPEIPVTTANPERPSTKETTAAAASSTEETVEGSSTVASTKASSSPETTAPAVLPSTELSSNGLPSSALSSSAQTGAANGTATTDSTAEPTTTDIKGAGALVKGSVMAAVGAVVGVVMFV